MKILFVTASYKPAYIYGGPIVVIALLAESLVKLGHDVTVYTTTANGAEELDVTTGEKVFIDGVGVYYFDRITKDHTHISTSLWKKLRSEISDFDTVHLHGWWNLLIIGAAIICKTKGIKPFLSPHGMFSNYILKTNNGLAKRIIQRLIGERLLKNSILHVSTEMELKESRKMVAGWEGMIIPNLVTLSEENYSRPTNEIFKIGFISRIDPKKGLDILIKTLATVSFPFILQVAGSGNDEYIQELKQLAAESGIASQIEWVGWKTGEKKFEFLAGLDLFALTSHSENFAIVVIESLSVGTPVFISDQVGLFDYIKRAGYGWVTSLKNPSMNDLLNSIQKDREKLAEISRRAQKEVPEAYSPLILAAQYADFYKKYCR